MTFPVVIEGRGDIIGELRLLGFADTSHRTLTDFELDTGGAELERKDVEYFCYVCRELREFLGTQLLKRSSSLHVAITDGGYLSMADPRSERIAVPYQLLKQGVLPISEEARQAILVTNAKMLFPPR